MTAVRPDAYDTIEVFFAEKELDLSLTWTLFYETYGTRIQGNIGGTGLTFEGMCDSEKPKRSAWRLTYLNGVCLVNPDGRYSDCIWCLVPDQQIDEL